jgi:hypothetical protein
MSERNWERDTFLTDAILGCEHHYSSYPKPYGYGDFDTEEVCDKCNHKECDIIFFAEWKGYGKLFEWAEKQIWWSDFIDCHGKLDCDCGCADGELAIHFMKPAGCYNFPDEVYEYLSVWRERRIALRQYRGPK